MCGRVASDQPLTSHFGSGLGRAFEIERGSRVPGNAQARQPRLVRQGCGMGTCQRYVRTLVAVVSGIMTMLMSIASVIACRERIAMLMVQVCR